MGGNASKKLAARCELLTRDEQKFIAQTFRMASRNSDKIKEDDLIVSGTLDAELLEKHWGPQIDPRLALYLTNYLFGLGPDRAAFCNFNKFAELYVYNVRGSTDERMEVLYTSLGKIYDMNNPVDLPFQLLKEFCEALASTYMKVIKLENGSQVRAWTEKGFGGRAARVQALGEAVAAAADPDQDGAGASVTASMLYSWLSHNTLLRYLAETVFVYLYGVSECTPVPSVLPMPEGIESMPDYPSFTDLSHIAWINKNLPVKHQHKWRFLFSSHVHGESFSTMAGRIIDQGPSVLIIEDHSGHIFGGFASEAWAIGPNFYGGEDSFLFSLAPKMRIYYATTYNNHYQYMNMHTKTLPNGLIMGGQLDFGGIFVQAEHFGNGSCAESCSTYRGLKRLSRDKDFKIRSMEVWGVGDKPLTVRDSDERDTSCLDGNYEAKAILDLAGKSRHSEGLREPPPDDY